VAFFLRVRRVRDASQRERQGYEQQDDERDEAEQQGHELILSLRSRPARRFAGDVAT